MLKVIGCFVEAHDYRLVALAALVCALACVAAVQLARHAQRLSGGSKIAWLSVAATAAGSGIWATHFIAMLAFMPGVPTGYDLDLTVLSLVYAILVTGCGLALALCTTMPGAAWAGGALVGGGIAAMHYTGMTAFEVAGRIVWDPGLVAASLVIGAALGSAALVAALGGRSAACQGAGALLLLLAICGHHFTAMGAVAIVPDPTVTVAVSAVPTSWLAVAVAVASLAILLLAAAAMMIDVHERRRTALEGERLRSLANAAVEGLLVCRGACIVNANESFAALVGIAATNLEGMSLATFLPGEAGAPATGEQTLETELMRPDGFTIPVEIVTRPIDYSRVPHRAVAVRDMRARRKAERQIQFLALHDSLTGLANRTSFNRRLDGDIEAAKAKGGKLAVLCFDLDRFKEVNDVFGHAAGDTLLQDFARIVTGVLKPTQMMGRLGGDEFAVVTEVDHAVAAGRLAERILETLRQEGANAAGPLIATSIGIAVYPEDATERALLLGCADTALYRAKSEGRGTYRYYETRMGAEVRKRRRLEHDLRHAIARGEMRLAYQPQTRTDTGEVLGFEALLRWHNAEHGAIAPSLFIPIAEEGGLILQIGDWVLHEACREAASWPVPLTVAVNVSAVQIHCPDFVRSLEDILRRTGLRASRLEIEITETALIRDPTRALSALRQIKALGVRIAMDDFGTGYSSLSNLRSFPFDKIKIDRSFIKSVDANAQTAAIVRSVLGLGRGLGLPVLAEGVETDQELSFLLDEQCSEAQGYLMGKPSAIETFAIYTHGPEAGRVAPAAA